MATKTTKPTTNTKTAKTAPPKDYRNNSIVVPVPAIHTEAQYAEAVAKTLTRPEIGAAAVIGVWQKDTHDINVLAAELGRQVEAVNSGDMQRVEGILIAQAHALDNIFANLARRAANQEYLKQWEAYMRMAMKAQNQCRMTLETLATIKNPPVVFARQANINNGGQQQVNNGAQAEAPRAPAHFAHATAHAANPATAQTGLLGVSDGERMDTRAAGTTSGTDPLETTMGVINRASHG